jgi:hypothetical protein
VTSRANVAHQNVANQNVANQNVGYQNVDCEDERCRPSEPDALSSELFAWMELCTRQRPRSSS